MNGGQLLENNISKSEIQEIVNTFEPLQSSFEHLVYNIANFSRDVDLTYITSNGATVDKSKF